MKEFLRQKPNKESFVIIDEVDIMSGCNSFYLDSHNNKSKSYYLYLVLKGY